jgi:hypothetical protein
MMNSKAGKSIINKLTYQIKKRAEKRLLDRINYLHVSETSSEDIYIVGYPRSGNTWMQNILVGIVFGLDSQYTPDSIVQELIPDIHYKQYYRRYITPMYFKSHNLPEPKYRRVIYLIRDGRDAMVSYYHYLKIINGEAKLLDMINNQNLFPSQWHTHVSAWTTNHFHADILVIRFEDMIMNPIIQLNRICDFIGINRTQYFLTDLSNTTTFLKMREKEIETGWDQSRNWPKDKHFIRRGVIGSHKDEMPENVFDLFTKRSQEMLQHYGYT